MCHPTSIHLLLKFTNYIMGPISYENGAISLSEIKNAADKIQGHANVTPVFQCSALDAMAGLDLYFKCEVFQKTGSFKFRGAFNAVSCLASSKASALTPSAAEKDPVSVVTHSSGNHAAAIALAAQMHNIIAHIVVPSNTPRIKQEAVKSYGGNLILCEPTIEAREAGCAAVQAENPGATFIPPYNHPWVICGQGTIGIEFLQQMASFSNSPPATKTGASNSNNEISQLDAIIVPVSGGGMIGGIAVAAKSLNPSIKIIAAEPCGKNNAADVAACKAAQELIHCAKPDTICDGLQARLGSITWPIVRDLVDEVVVVTEEEVVEAMKLCYERMKVVVEPSGAAGLAAALQLKQQKPEFSVNVKKVGVILCGGNVDFDGKVPGFWNTWLS
jgi:serine racemase